MELPEGRLFVFNWLISNVCIPERSDLKRTEVDGGASVHFLKSDPDSGDAELRFPAANTVDSFMLSSFSDPLMFGSAIKFSQCGGSHKANLKAGFVQFPHVLAKMNSKFAYTFLITTFPTFQTF